MKCPRCQQDNPSHAKFCLVCGVPVGGLAPVPKSYGDLKDEIEHLRNVLSEAIQQKTATSEILQVISRSPTDTQPVFDAIAVNAARLCAATTSMVALLEGDSLNYVARHNFPADFVDSRMSLSDAPNATRVIREGIILHIVDTESDVRVTPAALRLLRRIGARAVLSVPMKRGDTPVGSIIVHRAQPGSFSNDHVELLKTFADQAVIAIENVRLFKELEEKNRALTEAHARVSEALDRQTATSDILRVIASSPTDEQPVFEAIVRSALRLLDGYSAVLRSLRGNELHLVAFTSTTPEGDTALAQSSVVPVSATGYYTRVVETRMPVVVEDTETDSEFAPQARIVARARGYRSLLSVPLLRGESVLGVINVSRRTAGSFSGDVIALLQTFADQAVIAIENVRLFKELEARNRDLTEALEQQTATSEVLKVISRSAFDLQPVLETLVENATRLCGADRGSIVRPNGDLYRVAAVYGASSEYKEFLERNPPRAGRGTVVGRVALDRRTVHIEDVLQDPEYQWTEAQSVEGFRTVLGVPMLREDTLLGIFIIWRDEVGPFTDKQIELVRTFADQAVIAIENVRLFKELEARNRDLTETLEQQTATSEILRVISSSPTDIQPVFDAIAASATRLCGAVNGLVGRFDGQLMHMVAHHNVAPERLDALRQAYPRPADRGSLSGRVVTSRAVVHVEDVDADPEYTLPRATTVGYRSVLGVPMLREGAAIGYILVARDHVAAFSEKQIALLKTFADQAVIAIENVRLFKELEARTDELTQSVEKLTALGEVSRSVSSTLDVETVLDTIVSRASQLAGADGCSIYEYDEATERFELHATHHYDAEFIKALRAAPLRKGEGLMGRAAEMREPIQIPDITRPGAYQSSVRDTLVRFGYRALLSVPLLREDQIIGSLSFNRKEPGEFPPEVVDVLKTFATQSALAIQNARLFREIADKSAQLEAASQHKSEFLANMSHELRTPLNAIIGFSEVLSERMFGELNEKQSEYLKDIYASGQHLLSLINDILDLSKIEAGRMELEAADFDLPSAIDNALILVRERATRRGITLGRTVDDRLGIVRGDERKVKQVLLNLLSNALKFTPEGGRIDVSAHLQDGGAEIAVTDTGVGIAPGDQEAIFEEFRQVGTADKKVEGTGLGLALSRKFIELHGGRIWVQSKVGKGSTFTFTLPMS